MPKTPKKNNIKVDVQEIYGELCSKCQKKIVALLAKKFTTSSIEEQLRKQLERKGE